MTLYSCFCAVYLTGDQVIAATRECMEDTIKFIGEKYGTVDKYLRSVCLLHRPCTFNSTELCRSGQTLALDLHVGKAA